MSKQAYYQYDEDAAHARAAREEFALQYIKAIRQLAPGMGGTKLWYMYREEFGCDHPIGRDRFCRIINEHQLKVRQKPRRPRTTDSAHGLPTFPNLIRSFIPDAANQLWVSDITYLAIMDDRTHYHFCYLSLILDAYTEEIVGWSVGPTLDTAYPLEALRMALRRVPDGPTRLIHHSDRGCQYASREYVEQLRQHGVSISMSQTGDPKENAQAERINNTMKHELLRGKELTSLNEAVAAVAVAVDFYNNRRPHMSIGMAVPADMLHATGERDMRWISYRQRSIKSQSGNDNAEKCLPLLPERGCPSAYGLQSTPLRDKAQQVNPNQE